MIRIGDRWDLSVLRSVALVPALGLLAMLPDAALSQPSDWIYDIFVKECREAGGRPASSMEEYRRGEQFRCDRGGSGQSNAVPEGVCSTEAKEAVDWVFRDKGARATYTRLFSEGRTPFDSVVGAQGHNPSAQDVLLGCRPWVETYLASLGATRNGPALGNRKLDARDCECISVIPVGANEQGRATYRVSNSCDGMNVAVRFVGDILSLSARDAFSSWGSAGLLAYGLSSEVMAPDLKYTSIATVKLKNASSSYTCNF
jgi:hypothetical protein